MGDELREQFLKLDRSLLAIGPESQDVIQHLNSDRSFFRCLAATMLFAALAPNAVAQVDSLRDTLPPAVGVPTEPVDAKAQDWSDDPSVRMMAGAAQTAAAQSTVRQSVQTGLTFAAIALLPIGLLMTTGYIRLAVVLGLLRQAFGAGQTPPPQITAALAFFLTVLVMSPVWLQVKREAVDPYLATENAITLEEAFARGSVPIKRFMSQQIIATGNGQDVWLFFKYLPEEMRENPPQTFNEVPLQVLIPAFMISELKTAFAIGFQIFLPFLIIDLIVTSLTTSMGMIMLPPSVISLPLKLAVFVAVDGWNLIVGMMLHSFAAV